MTGTTTFGKEEAAALFARHGLPEGGLIEAAGRLVAERDNPKDPNAVMVTVEGSRIGYLPGYVAARVRFGEGDSTSCQVQLWGAMDQGRLRVIGWAGFGDGAVDWPYTADSPPAITLDEQRAAHIAATTEMVDEAVNIPADPAWRAAHPSQALRAAQFEAGMVGGYHYLETVEPIKQLKRDGRLEEALVLCYGAIEAAEHAFPGQAPATFYTEQAAIIHRKRGERDEEIAVLQRWLDACPAKYRADSSIQARFDKLVTKG
jgi:hypothetical protein